MFSSNCDIVNNKHNNDRRNHSKDRDGTGLMLQIVMVMV